MANFWENDAIDSGETAAADTGGDWWKKDQVVPTEKPEAPIKKYGKEALGVGEAALSQVTGTAAAAYGGLKGLLTIATGGSADDATKQIQQAAEDYTYQPRSKTGKKINDILALPGEGLDYIGKKAGGAVGEVLGDRDAGEAVGSTIAQGLPVVLTGKSLLNSPKTAALSRRLSETVNKTRSTRYGAGERGSVGIPPENNPTPFGAASSEFLDTPPPSSTIPSDTVLKRRGWTDSEIERIKRYDKQGITPMLGDITREPSDVRFQDQSAARGAGSGGRHYDVYAQKLKQNQQLYDAFDNLKSTINDENGNPIKTFTPEETSRAIRDDIEASRKEAKQGASDLYKQADESGHTLDLVDPLPLDDLMYELRNAISVPEVKRIASKWEELKKKNEYDDFSLLDAKGNPINPPTVEISIRDLENLRKEATKLRKASPSANFYLKDVIGKIDEITDGKGGDLYKAARQAFSDYAGKYKTLKGIKDVTDADMFSGEFRVPEEQLFNRLVVGKTKGFEGFKNVYDNLSIPTQDLIKNQVIQFIQEEGFKGQKSLQSGQAPFSPANIHRAIQKVGQQKLRYILGEEDFKNLQDLSRSATELKAPSYRVNGSDTYANFASRLSSLAIKGIKKVPGIPAIATLGENLLNTAIEDSKIKKYLNPLESRRRYNRQGGGVFVNTGRKLSSSLVPAAALPRNNPPQSTSTGE